MLGGEPEKAGILRKHGALFRIVAVGLDGHQALFAGAGEKFEQHFHGFHVSGFAVLRAAKDAGEAARHFLEDVERIGNENGAGSGAANNNDEFGGLEKPLDIAVLHLK